MRTSKGASGFPVVVERRSKDHRAALDALAGTTTGIEVLEPFWDHMV